MFKLSNPPYGESPELARWLYEQLSEIKRHVTVENWHEVGAVGEPAFQNGWVNYGGADATAAFYRDPFGRVHMKGLVKSGTVPAIIFTLPVGYRPLKSEYFSTVANSGFGALDVRSSGDIYSRAGSNVWFSINCSFRAA